MALPSISYAAPPGPTLGDSVSLTVAPAVVPAPDFDSTILALNATSGPSGENPSGLVRFDTLGGHFHLGGPVTCLAVNGNTATISFPSQMDFFGDTITVEVVDDQPDTWAFADSTETERRTPTDCSPLGDAPGVHRNPCLAAISLWSIPSRRQRGASASTTAGSSSASRIRGSASPSSTRARRRESQGCRSRAVTTSRPAPSPIRRFSETAVLASHPPLRRGILRGRCRRRTSN